MYICIYTYVCMYVEMSVYVYVHISIRIYIYIYQYSYIVIVYLYICKIRFLFSTGNYKIHERAFTTTTSRPRASFHRYCFDVSFVDSHASED